MKWVRQFGGGGGHDTIEGNAGKDTISGGIGNDSILGGDDDDKIDGDPLSINFGREKVHKPLSTERMLAGATIDWLISFPLEARPKALCARLTMPAPGHFRVQWIAGLAALALLSLAWTLALA